MTAMRVDRSARKKAPPRGRRRLRRLLLGIGAPLAVALAILLLVAYVQVTITFEGRVWTLPSRVYSAGLHVVPGMAIDGATLATPWDSTNPATTIYTH